MSKHDVNEANPPQVELKCPYEFPAGAVEEVRHMPTMRFIDPSGAAHDVAIEHERSVMGAAVNHDVPGLIGECGGDMSCGTCHVYVHPDWFGRLAPASPEELEMLEVSADPRPESRLGCQIELDPSLEGLIVTVAVDDL